MVPTAVHTRLPFVMAYDLDAVAHRRDQARLFRRAIDEHWLVIWGHDRDHMGGRLGLDKDDNFVVAELVTI